MPYKKRVVIFLSAMLGAFLLLGALYIMSVKANMGGFDTEELRLDEFKSIKSDLDTRVKDRVQFE